VRTIYPQWDDIFPLGHYNRGFQIFKVAVCVRDDIGRHFRCGLELGILPFLILRGREYLCKVGIGINAWFEDLFGDRRHITQVDSISTRDHANGEGGF